MQNRRRALLDKAEFLFAEHGFEGTSIRDLAKEAGMNLAMISYYFGSKEKLFEALVEDRSSSLLEKVKAPNESTSDPVQRLAALVPSLVDRWLANPRFYRILYREASLNSRPELKRIIADTLLRQVNEFRKILQDGVEQGRFREVDIDLTMVTFYGTITQLLSASPQMHQRMLGRRWVDDVSEMAHWRNRLVDHLLQVMQAHLLTRA